MKPSLHLFDLIQSLTKEEKRFFKLSISRYEKKKGSTSLQLFNALSKLEEYDEDTFKLKYKNASFVKHLAKEKNYLYKKLIECLDINQGERLLEGRILRMLRQLRVLSEKGLIEQQVELLQKIKILAYEGECWPELLKILYWERKYSTWENIAAKYQISFEKCEEEIKRIYQHLNNIDFYWTIERKIANYYSTKGVRKVDEFQHLFQNQIKVLEKTDTTEMCTRTKYHIYQSCYLYYSTVTNYKGAYHNISKVVDILESNLHVLMDNMGIYITALYHLAISTERCEGYEDALKLIKKIKEAYLQYPVHQVKVRTSFETILLELLFYNSSGNFHKIYSKIDQIEKIITLYKSRTDSMKISAFHYCLAYSCYGVEDYKKTRYYLAKLLEVKHYHYVDVYLIGKLLLLIVYYETKEYDLLHYAILSTYRDLRKRQRVYALEQIILNVLRKASSYNTQQEFIDLLAEYQPEVERLKSQPSEQLIFQLFDFYSWIQSKIENKKFADVVQKNYRKEKNVQKLAY